MDIDTLKRSEQDIKAARAYAEAIVRTMRDPLLVLQADLKVNTANEAFYKTFKVSPVECEGRLIYELGDGQWNIPKLRELLEEILPRNSSFDNFEITHDFAIIGRRTMLLNARKLNDAEGRPARILLGIQDITETLQFQTAVRESQTRYQALVDASAQSVWTADSNGAVVEDSPASRAFTGQTYEQWKGLGWLDTLHPEDRERISELWQRAVAERTPVQTLYRVRHVSGEWRWTAVRAVPVLYPDGSVREWVGMNNDISERKQAEEALRESEERYRSLFDSIDEGFCIVEMIFDEHEKAVDYRFLQVSPSFEKQTGLKDAQGKKMRELSPQHEEHWFEIYGKIALTGEPARFQNRAEQLHRWYDVYAFRFGEPENRRVAIIFTDITERKRAEEALRDSEAALKEADRRKDEFLGMLAHELRSPLSAISNVAEILWQQPTSDPETTRLQSMLTRQTRTLTRMVEDLLDISRISSGKIRVEKELIALSPVIRRAVESTRSLMESRRHELIVSEPEDPLRIEADATRLEQILVNLLSNATKYTDPGGRIHLIAKQENGEVCLMVRDNGIGISAEMLSGVFEMFTQVDQSLERTQHGLGIGLALVRSLVEMHGGPSRPPAPAWAKAASLSCGYPWEPFRSKTGAHKKQGSRQCSRRLDRHGASSSWRTTRTPRKASRP